MYILYFDYVALVLNIINIVTFYYRKNLHDKKSKVLLILIINSILTTCTDILSTVTLGNPDNYTYWYSFSITNIYYFFNNCKIYIYVAYVFTLSGRWNHLSKFKKVFIFIPFIITIFYVMVNPLTKSIFYIDRNLIYHRAIGLVILYMIAGLYMIYATVCTIKSKKIIKPSIFRALFIFLFTYAFINITQTLFPKYLLQCLSSAICEMLILMTMQNTYEVMDSATGLYNRNAFFKTTNFYLQSENAFSIILIALEDTARISYTLGIRNLNKIIKEVALFLKKNVDVDEIYYLSGKCFALILCNDRNERKNQANIQIISRFKEIWKINDMDINLSARICHMDCPKDVANTSDIFDYVNFMSFDNYLLHKHKFSGVSEVSLTNRKREAEIRKVIAASIEPNLFEVYYQPIYSVKDKCFVSAEALVRLKDKKLGFIPPDEFIPISERDGTIIKIGLSIFEMVCAFIKEANLTEKGIQFMEVNLSVVQCMQCELKEQLMSLLDKYQLQPNQICLEITETIAANSPEPMNRIVRELNQEQMFFALDDYGIGFSNISYILELPFHYVKLDKSIVWAYFENEKGRIALESTIALMKQLNLEIIAEGVETKEQADALEGLGVDFLQGYYFSKPVPKDEFVHIISKINKNNGVTD